MLTGRVLITGGSGFLGRGILRRLHRDGWPARVTVYSRDEFKQYQIKRRWPQVSCVLGDVRDRDRLAAIMLGHDTVIHAGAVKFIPEAESNIAETLAVNITGSENVARAAVEAGIKTVIGISTDKACGPLNAYGATKMLMERLFAEANRWGDTRFATVRYGNVVGSTGSVVPVFLDQIRDHGEIRVTDENMTRFWLSVDQAVDLIVRAVDNADAYPGHTFIDACPAMTIRALAEAVWSHRYNYGTQLEPEIKVIGVRPGEKFHESLFNEQESPRVEADDDLGFRLRPATSAPVTSALTSYDSNQPCRWIGKEEMIAMIRDAQQLWM